MQGPIAYAGLGGMGSPGPPPTPIEVLFLFGLNWLSEGSVDDNAPSPLGLSWACAASAA